MVVRRVFVTIPPGATPVKRKAPSDIAEGQIRKPGDEGSEETEVPPAPHKKGKHKAKPPKPASSSSSSGGDNSSSPSDVEIVTGSTASMELMPSALGAGPVFAALVAAKCQLPWVAMAVLESELPAPYRSHLFRRKMWATRSARNTTK